MQIIPGLIVYLILMISLGVREWARGYVAHKLGDPTPAASGRLTPNPLAHVDPMGTVILPLAMILLVPGFMIFAWTKPIPINPLYFRRRKHCELVLSLAGLLFSLILAVFFALIGACAVKCFGGNIGSLFATAALLNVALFAFNLIPVPPSDGAFILKTVFRISEELFLCLSRCRFLILLVLINIPTFRFAMLACVAKIFELINALACGLFGISQSALLPF